MTARILVLVWCLGACQRTAPPSAVTDDRGGPLDPRAMDALVAELRADPAEDLKGLVVMIGGDVVREEYFNGLRPADLHDIRSAGKSITSLLVGIALDRGLIRDVHQPLSAVLGVAAMGDRAAITMEDVLTMRSGLAALDVDPASPGNEDRLDASDDWLGFALHVPMASAPGRTYHYASVNAFLAGAVIEKVAGMDLHAFASRHLFGPLGIHDVRWRRGPRGEGAGQGNLMLRLRDLATLGQLILDGGTYRGTRLISQSWITASLAPRITVSAVDRFADHYGYMWYRKAYPVGAGTITVHVASGNGGNKLYVVPAHRMVVAIMSSAYGQPHGQPRSEQILLRTLSALNRGVR
jgi:CubicO group peptidase (beta-lactamase class C family)